MGLTEEGDELEERDETKVALEEALRRIRGLKADEGEQEQETYFVTLEAEVLDDGVFKQFTQLRRNWWRCPRCWETCSRQSWAPCSWTAGTTWPPCGAYTPDSASSSTR